MVNKKVILTGLVILSLISIIYIVYLSKKEASQKQNIPTVGVPYGSLTPGVSTVDDITKQMGTSEKETASGSAKILEYKSKNPNFNNELIIDNNKLTFVKQIVAYGEPITVEDLNKKYGIYENVLYGHLSQNGFHLYVYPDRGIAYVANQEANIVLEIWYFQPTTLENFKTLYAPDYSDTYKPFGQ